MYCQKCGKEIDDNAAFCTFCGSPTVNASAVNNVISDGSEDKKEKTLIIVKKIGIAVIIILIIIVVILAVGGTKNKVADTAETTTNKVTNAAEATANKVTDTAESTTKTSALNDIIGDWRMCVNWGSDSYADSYNRVYYFRVEAEGITGLDAASINDKFYAVGVDDITIQEEDGIKYYTYSAKMTGGWRTRSSQIIGIRLYLDEESGWLVCAINTPEDGFWQRVSVYKPLTISIEEVIERWRKGTSEEDFWKEKLEGKYFSTMEEAIADDDFRNWFEYEIWSSAGIGGLHNTYEYNADGNNLIIDVKLRDEKESPDSKLEDCSRKVDGWIKECRKMLNEQNGNDPITVTIHCVSSDGRESAEGTYGH